MYYLSLYLYLNSSHVDDLGGGGKKEGTAKKENMDNICAKRGCSQEGRTKVNNREILSRAVYLNAIEMGGSAPERKGRWKLL